MSEFHFEESSIAFIDQLSGVKLNAWLCVAAVLGWILFSYTRQKSPRRLPGVYMVGLDGGKRSIEQARKHFITNCEELMFEGYQKVGSLHKHNEQPIF
jgi:hypothetical protein